jgi:hypothetical protein
MLDVREIMDFKLGACVLLNGNYGSGYNHTLGHHWDEINPSVHAEMSVLDLYMKQRRIFRNFAYLGVSVSSRRQSFRKK